VRMSSGGEATAGDTANHRAQLQAHGLSTLRVCDLE
jgi:hypothetical protein